MVGLTTLEVYNSVFNLTTTNHKFELHTDTFDEFSFEELKDELEEVLNISNITPKHLQDEIIGPRIISANKKIRNKTETDGWLLHVISGLCSINFS